MSEGKGVFLPFILVTLIWSSTWIVIRDQLGNVPPSWSVCYRFLLAGSAMAIFARLRGLPLNIGGRGLAFAGLLGTAQFVMNFNFVYRAEHYLTSGVVAVIYAMLLIPNSTLAYLFFRQPVSRAFIAGSGNVNKIYLGALLELLLILANIGTAVVIVPIMRRRFEDLAIGYVTARIVESTFILVGILAMLGIATLQQGTAGAAEATVAYTLAAIKDWSFILGPGWMVGWGNGLILGYMMYRTQLVPRAWTWLGLVGGPLIILSGTAVLFTGNDPSSALHSLQAIATIPEFLWELFLGIYCTVWGFKRDAPILAGSAA